MRRLDLLAIPALTLLFATDLFTQTPYPNRQAELDGRMVRVAAQMTEAQAAEVEAHIDNLPNQRDEQVLLAHFWHLHAGSNLTLPVGEARRRHVLWLINDSPADPSFENPSASSAFAERKAPGLERMKLDLGTWETHLQEEPRDAKPKPPTRVRVGGHIMESKLKKKVYPVYPESARQKGVRGTVRLDVVVGKDGKVMELKVVSGPFELRGVSISAVKKWEYEPTSIQGNPVEVLTVVEVTFGRK